MVHPSLVLHVTLGDAPPDRLDKALARDVPEEAARHALV
jgi:23S rRNA pseudouridine1911/1915/1917 synthase